MCPGDTDAPAVAKTSFSHKTKDGIVYKLLEPWGTDHFGTL